MASKQYPSREQKKPKSFTSRRPGKKKKGNPQGVLRLGHERLIWQ